MQAEQFEDVPMHIIVRVLARFLLLGRRLFSALQRSAQGERGRQITLAAEAELRDGRSIKGLVILRMIFHYYQTNKTADLVYDITDLYKVSMKGNNAEGFQNTWVSVLRGMRKPPDPDMLELLYFKCIERFNGIAEDVAHYNRSDESSPDHCYEYLFNAVQRYLQRTRQQANREKVSAAVLGSGHASALAPPKGGGRGRGRGGGRGGAQAKSRERSDSRARSSSTNGDRPPKKDRPCRLYFAEGETCNHGSSCEFSHTKQPQKREAEWGESPGSAELFGWPLRFS